MDTLALLYALLGGGFMGSYPVPIKAPAVLEAHVHPIVFQWYKSIWVFVAGWVLVCVNYMQGGGEGFQFTWWAVASAAAWIPGGLCTIAAVPRIGVGMVSVLSTGMASVLSFLVFWLVFRERLRAHGSAEHPFYLAPLYLVFVVLGMAGVVAALRLSRAGQVGQGQGYAATDLDEEPQDAKPCAGGNWQLGLLLAALAGLLSAAQFAAVTVGRRAAMRADGCEGRMADCSPALQEQFDTFGSWMASFGIGAVLVTSIYSALWLAAERLLWGAALPSMHWRVMRGPGSIAGIFWVLGNLFQTAAVVRGGNALFMPTTCGVQLLTSSLWGVAWYKEIRDRKRMAVWALAVAWTLASTVLLSGEKGAA